MNYNNKPPNVDLKYRVLCPSEPDWKLQSLRCDNITIGSEVTDKILLSYFLNDSRHVKIN